MNFNDYNNQNNNPENGNRPDYVYNWNGSEHGRRSRRSNGRKFGIVALVIILIAVLTVSTVVGLISIEGRDYGKTQSGSGETSAQSAAAEKTDSDVEASETKHGSRGDVSVPDFTPNSSSVKGESDLTAIYESASVSCCTVKVTYGSSVGGYSIGSGFVIDDEGGYIATNHHVIENAKKITVTFYDGNKYDAELIGSDATTDIAVLKIDAEGLVKLPIGNSSELKIGEQVMAIGTPYSEELAGTMTIGHVSGTARNVEITNDSGKVIKIMTLIQTDCAINPGNSGGPLIDMAGNVVGINSLKIASEKYEGLGFAIPITSATEIFAKLIAGEDIGESDIASATPKLGVTIYELQHGFETFRLTPRCEYPEGVLIGSIEADSAVYEAGLEMYDIVTEFNGVKVTSNQEFIDELNKYKAGQEVTMTVFRFNRRLTAGETLTLKFKLDAAS